MEPCNTLGERLLLGKEWQGTGGAGGLRRPASHLRHPNTPVPFISWALLKVNAWTLFTSLSLSTIQLGWSQAERVAPQDWLVRERKHGRRPVGRAMTSHALVWPGPDCHPQESGRTACPKMAGGRGRSAERGLLNRWQALMEESGHLSLRERWDLYLVSTNAGLGFFPQSETLAETRRCWHDYGLVTSSGVSQPNRGSRVPKLTCLQGKELPPQHSANSFSPLKYYHLPFVSPLTVWGGGVGEHHTKVLHQNQCHRDRDWIAKWGDGGDRYNCTQVTHSRTTEDTEIEGIHSNKRVGADNKHWDSLVKRKGGPTLHLGGHSL